MIHSKRGKESEIRDRERKCCGNYGRQKYDANW